MFLQHFLSLLLVLICEGTAFFRINPFDEPFEEQLEDSEIFFDSSFVYLPVEVEFNLSDFNN